LPDIISSMAKPAPPDFCYFTRHAGEVIRERGEIDLDAALLLLKHFHWLADADVVDEAAELPGVRSLLARMHRGSPAPSRHPAVRDPEAACSLIGFQDRAHAELVVSRVGDAFHLDFAEPVVRRILPGMHVTRWTLRGAATREMDDVFSIAKLFFTGRKTVLDDILQAAERQPSRQSA
jgi:hypothetical protein